MSNIKKTKKNIHSNIMFPKVTSHTNKKNNNPPTEFIDSLLNKNKNHTKDSMKKNIIAFNKSSSNIQTGGDGKIIENFHKAIKLTNSDEIILKMLDLKEKDIVNFYKNMEKMIGKDLSLKIRNDMSKQLITGATVVNKNGTTLSLCPFCSESKSNCVILLCGHLLCNKCAKNINKCKYPYTKCKKHIKNIQIIKV